METVVGVIRKYACMHACSPVHSEMVFVARITLSGVQCVQKLLRNTEVENRY